MKFLTLVSTMALALFCSASFAGQKMAKRQPSSATNVDMTKGLKSLTTEDDVVKIKVSPAVQAPSDNSCASSNLQGGLLTLTLTKSMAQGESCSVKISDGQKSVRITFHISESDD